MAEGVQRHRDVDRYLRLLVLLGSPFAGAELVAALLFGSLRLAALGLSVGMLVALAAWGCREARKGCSERVLPVVGWQLLLLTMVGALAVPQLGVTYVLVPVLALAATLPSLERPVLTRFVVASVAAETLVVCTSAFLPPAPGIPQAFIQVHLVAALVGEAAVVLLLLSQSRLQLRARLQQVVRSEARFRSLVEATAAVVWTADAQGRVRTSPRWLAFTGQTPAEGAGLGWLEALHPHERALALRTWRDAVARPAPQFMELRVRRARGGYAWLQVRAAPVRGPQGQVLEWIGAAVDVTAQRLAQDRRRALTEVGAVLAGTLDLEETLQRIAQVAVPRLADGCVVRLCGGSGLEPVSEPMMGVAHEDPEDEARLRSLVSSSPVLREMAKGSEAVQRSGRAHLVADFSREARALLGQLTPAEARGVAALELRSLLHVPLPGRSGPVLGALCLVTTGEDARRFGTEDVEAAEEMGRRCGLALENALLYRQAQEAVRTREDFLAVASHELRTPLAALGLSVESLERHLESTSGRADPQWIRERVRRLRRHARRLERLVEALLDVSRIAGGRLRLELEEVDLASLTRAAVERLREETGSAERVGERVRVHASGPVVGRWDRLRVEQVVENLVANALKYGERGPVEVTVAREGEHAVLRVEDEGLGIPPEKHDAIWDKFERHVSGRNYGGLGLGLYIVRAAVEALGGEVRVESAAGHGAAFTVQLPLAGPAPRHAAPERIRALHDLPPPADARH